MKPSLLLLAAGDVVLAFPGLMGVIRSPESSQIDKRAIVYPPDRPPQYKGTRPNTGLPPPPFNAEDQLVSTTGDHIWIAPGPNDLRGPCPGLNAAANHGYLSRSGISSIPEAIAGLQQAYNVGPDAGAALSIIAVALSGNPITGTWSIGGEYAGAAGLFPTRGISDTHDKYEGDGSITRGDAYLHNGSPLIVEMHKFNNIWNIMGDNFGFDQANMQVDYSRQYSIANNPYFFTASFGPIVAAAAHELVVNLMSNHSAENPGGTLNKENMKSFFSIEGDAPGNFSHIVGYERIPDNWYRRPTVLAYNIADLGLDLAQLVTQYPGTLSPGGNAGKVNTFTGVDLGNLTGGVFNAETLFEGNNFACFFYQASLQALPDAAEPLLGAVGSILGWAESQFGPFTSALNCPQLAQFNNQLLNKYPGSTAGTGNGDPVGTQPNGARES
ncbi:hypothetical protein LTR78_008095 [Recurvomyces mirabilis]|uniref:Heme haloperoxidase family profile domain-containing protein n=1 Tax=Recurvomyces mirabilis TaxID=574656 RepID=A0AAE0TTP7_9PEZI|nr:hypothetical protein LTR78_008095 [Recurvomyces mirabilis]KAK5150822.1 hypothetical protein LTS14_009886 [Recurvomyces mirabilis]